MLDYPSIAALAAVIREGSFERGAAALKITPSAISQRVRGLEDRLGTVLVVRGQPCRPTALGRALCAHLDRVHLLEHEIAPELGLGAPITLRIAVNADSLASWFSAAAAAIGATGDLSLDLTLDDEGHTADRLRAGQVIAAVTADAEPVQGCRTTRLGALRYAACASPAFVAAHFPDGVTADALARAPHLRFDRRDRLQERWARDHFGIELTSRAHWIPSTDGFLALAVAGLGWNLQPLALVTDQLAAGRLVELKPGAYLDVALHWTVTRLHAATLDRLTAAVLAAAQAGLIKPPRAAS